jgi:hypothetical protein
MMDLFAGCDICPNRRSPERPTDRLPARTALPPACRGVNPEFLLIRIIMEEVTLAPNR